MIPYLVLFYAYLVSGFMKKLTGNCGGIIAQKPRRQSMNCGASNYGFVCEISKSHVLFIISKS